MKLKLSKKEWDLILKALGGFESTEDDYEKKCEEEGSAEGLAERIDTNYCEFYNV